MKSAFKSLLCSFVLVCGYTLFLFFAFLVFVAFSGSPFSEHFRALTMPLALPNLFYLHFFPPQMAEMVGRPPLWATLAHLFCHFGINTLIYYVPIRWVLARRQRGNLR